MTASWYSRCPFLRREIDVASPHAGPENGITEECLWAAEASVGANVVDIQLPRTAFCKGYGAPNTQHVRTEYGIQDFT